MSKSQAPLIVKRVNEELLKEQQKRLAFYEWVDEDMKAEFINGEIIIHSPIMKEHNDATKGLLSLLDNYVIKYNLGYVGVEKVMVRFSRNDYEPDVCFFNKKKSATFKKGQHLFPVPDLVVEVKSKSTAKSDKDTKFKDYEQHSVGEYWMIDPIKEIVEQYVLVKGVYKLQKKATDGNILSKVVKGFEIPVRAIFDTDVRLDTLRKILLA
ncbi:MAG: Uma2 family endonuclease [Saprospiraceae bacterium]